MLGGLPLVWVRSGMNSATLERNKFRAPLGLDGPNGVRIGGGCSFWDGVGGDAGWRWADGGWVAV